MEVARCHDVVLRWSGVLTVSNAAFGWAVTLKHDTWISPWKAAAVARLAANEDYYALLIVMADDLSISELIVLRQVPLPRTMSLENLQNLYPSLPSAPRT